MAPRKEYYGKLFFDKTDQLVELFPVIWFRTDDCGGWTRLTSKLQNNGLNFHGSGVPSNPREVLVAVQEMVDGVRDDGIEFSFNLKKPLSFSALVKRLEQLGIIRASNPGINPNPLLAAPPGPHAH